MNSTSRRRHTRPQLLVAAAAAFAVGSPLVATSVSPAGAADSWQAEVIAPMSSHYLVLGLDPGGNAVALWAEGGTGSTTYGARRPAQGGWSDTSVLTHSNDSPDATALAPDGDAYWDGFGEYDDTVLKTWDDDGHVAGTGIGSRYGTLPMWTDPDDGDIVVADINPNRAAADRAIFYLRRPDEAGLTELLHDNTLHPVLAFTGGSDFALADVRRDGAVRVQRVDVETNQATTVLRRDAGCAEPQHLAVRFDARGRGAVAWRCDGRQDTIRAVYLRPDGASSTADVVTTRASRGGRLQGPTLAAAPGGVVTLVYGPQPDSGASVRVKTRRPATGWSGPTVLADDQQQVFGLGMRSAKSGAALVTWTDGTTVRALLRQPGGTFGAPSTVTTAPSLTVPKPFVTRDGHGFVTLHPDAAPSPVTVYTSPGS